MRYHAFVFLAVAACGDNKQAPVDSHPPIDMMVDGPPATGAHTHYVVDKINVPTTMAQAMMLALDLDGNGTPDNQLGTVLATLATQGFDAQAAVDVAIDRGQALLLVDLQADSLTTATTAGFVTWKGANSMPMPCSSAADTVCRHHLAGTGTFDLAADSWHDNALTGPIASSTLTAGPGDLTLQFPLFPNMPLTVTLIGSRVHATALADASIGMSLLGGAVSQSDVDMKLIPAVAAGFAPIIARDCSMLTNPP